MPKVKLFILQEKHNSKFVAEKDCLDHACGKTIKTHKKKKKKHIRDKQTEKANTSVLYTSLSVQLVEGHIQIICHWEILKWIFTKSFPWETKNEPVTLEMCKCISSENMLNLARGKPSNWTYALSQSFMILAHLFYSIVTLIYIIYIFPRPTSQREIKLVNLDIRNSH